jgi:DNA-binding SARP family transcriptional activator
LEKVIDLRQLPGGSMPGFESLPGPDGDFMVAVLGGFALFWGGSVLGIPRASQRLLAFLALHGGMVKRAAVAGTLWPDASESHAYSNLRSALARLQGTARRALATSKLELGLAEGVTVDVRHAQVLAWRLLDPAVTPDRSELGMAAVPALSADLLPDWYDDWVLIEAEDWRQLRLHALEALARRLTTAGRWGEAAGAARAAVRAEPLRESAQTVLIQVHLAEGNQSEAMREFDRYRALLHAELGVEPTPRIAHLLEDLQRR